MSLIIREENRGDISQIHSLVSAAFEGEAHADLVNQLREDEALLLSHVAELNDKIVGHAAYSLVTVTDGDIVQRFPALGPIGVLPRYQGRGIGSALVRAGLEAMNDVGYGLLFLVGSPLYYPRFGYQPAQPLGFTSDYVEDEGRHEHFMVAVLDEGVLGGARGHVRFHDAFSLS
ncbi:MAG: N-acetyltransferase [Chloroflexi bacterium]|nr:N-acetyltransferase [Chloroflexota bacterium]